jgi:hypothetical protein
MSRWIAESLIAAGLIGLGFCRVFFAEFPLSIAVQAFQAGKPLIDFRVISADRLVLATNENQFGSGFARAAR